MKAAHAVSASRRATFVTLSDLGVVSARTSVAMSVPLDLCRKAPAGRVVGVDGLDRRVSEQLADSGVRFARLGEDRLDHHSVPVEAAERQHSRLEHGRYLVDIVGARLLGLGDE